MVDPLQQLVPVQELQPYSELPVYGAPPPDRKWLIDTIIAQLGQGQFQNAGILADGMLRDSRVLGGLEQRNAALFGAPLELEPPDDSALAGRIRDEIQKGWDTMFPRPALEELHQHGVLMGLGIAEKSWDTSTKPWTFTIGLDSEGRGGVFHPQFYLWRWDMRSYYLLTLNGGLVPVPSCSTRWLVLAPYGYKRAYLRGRIRALVDPWMMRSWTKNDWAHWCEIHGAPIRKAIIPQRSSPAEAKEFVDSISKMGANTVIKARQDSDGNKYDIELVEAMSQGYEGFEKMLAWCDRSISTVLLGQASSTDGMPGLGAQEKPGQAVRQDIAAADNAKLCEALYVQCLREYCEVNYGNADLAPMPCYQVEPPEDENEAAKADLSISNALVSFRRADAPINVREYLEQRGYSLLTEQEVAAQKAAQVKAVNDNAGYTLPPKKPKQQELPMTSGYVATYTDPVTGKSNIMSGEIPGVIVKAHTRKHRKK